MSIQIRYDKQYTQVIHIRITGSWTWDEYYVAMDVLHHHMDASEHETFKFTLDIREQKQPPPFMLTTMRQVSEQRHPKSETMVVVGASKPIQAMFEVMAMVLPEHMRQIYLVQTMEEAKRIIFDN